MEDFIEDLEKYKYIKSPLLSKTGELFDIISSENFSRLSEYFDIWQHAENWEKFVFYEPFRNVLEAANEDVFHDNMKITNKQIIHFECSSDKIKDWLIKTHKFELLTNLLNSWKNNILKHSSTWTIISISEEFNTIWSKNLWSEDKIFSWKNDLIQNEESWFWYISIQQGNDDKNTLLNLITDAFEFWKYESVRIKTPFYLHDQNVVNATYYPLLNFETFCSVYNNFWV